MNKPIVEKDAYTHPAGGWGSIKAVSTAVLRERRSLSTMKALAVQNKSDGFACVSCAWAKPNDPHPAEFCDWIFRTHP